MHDKKNDSYQEGARGAQFTGSTVEDSLDYCQMPHRLIAHPVAAFHCGFDRHSFRHNCSSSLATAGGGAPIK